MKQYIISETQLFHITNSILKEQSVIGAANQGVIPFKRKEIKGLSSWLPKIALELKKRFFLRT